MIVVPLTLLCVAGLVGGSPKISDATVLLPNDAGAAVFTLFGENGCFSFSTDREDLLVLKVAQDLDCVTAVTISVNPLFDRATAQGSVRAIVSAREKNLGAELRSEVYLSSISRLELVTRIRRLSVGEVEAIQIQGFDRFGNTFSTLEGMEFKWDMTRGEPFLENIFLKDTEYSLSQARLGLERLGKQTDLFIVKGNRPGKALISASYANRGGREGQISTNPVHFSVIQPFRVTPSSIGIPFCGSAQLAITIGAGSIELLPNASFSFGIPAFARDTVLVKNDGKLISLLPESSQVSVSVTDVRTDDNEEHVRLCVGEISAVSVVADTLFPVIGEETRVRIAASSKDCPHIPELLLSSNVVSYLNVSDSSSSSFEVTQAHEVFIRANNSPMTVSGSIALSYSDQAGDSCRYSPNITSKFAIEIRAVESVVANVKNREIYIPVSETDVVVGLSGGSGGYALNNVNDVKVTTSSGGEKSIRIGPLGEGQVIVKDAFNEGNFDLFEIHRVVHATENVSFTLASNSSNIDAFIGFERPFEDFIVANYFDGLFFNCSSLVDSVSIADESIAQVQWSVSTRPYTCGKLSVIPKRPGKTVVSVISSLSRNFKISVTVFSAFKIRPIVPIYATHALMSVNTSFAYAVDGGALSSLKIEADEEVISLSHPWVADIATNRLKNEFKITCKTAGKSSAHVIHTSSGGIEFECIKSVESIGFLADARAPAASSVNSTIFVTCGHDEPFNLWVVSLDANGRKLDNSTVTTLAWNNNTESRISGTIKSVAPMDCGSEKTFSVVDPTKNSNLNATVVVKARDTVRAGIGHYLSRASPLHIPCNMKKASIFAMAFLGGSGEYAVTGQADFSVSARNERERIVIGVEEERAEFVEFSSKCSPLVEFSVSDTKISDSTIDISLALVPIESVHVHVLGAEDEADGSGPAFIVEREWTDLHVVVKFADGQIIDSVSQSKWFAVTESIFGWDIIANKKGDIRVLKNSGRIQIRIDENVNIVEIISRNLLLQNPITLTVSLVSRIRFSPSLPEGISEWTMAPFGSSELAARGRFSSELSYSFSSSNGNVVLVTPTSAHSVLVSAKQTAGTANITLTASTRSGRLVFEWIQPVRVVEAFGLKIRPFSVIINTNTLISAEPIVARRSSDDSELLIFPPTQIGKCEVKWSLYGSLTGQSVHYTFTQLGPNIPVKVLMTCASTPLQEASAVVSVLENSYRIQPIANLVKNANYPEIGFNITKNVSSSFQVIEISKSQIGTVIFGEVAHATLETSPNISVQVGQESVVARIVLLDKLGNELLFSPDFHHIISVGSDSPSFVDFALNHDKVVAKGLVSGCASVFVLFNKNRLAGTFPVCVTYPAVPAAGEHGLVLHINGEVEMRASNDLSRISLRNVSFDHLELWEKYVKNVRPWKIGSDITLESPSILESFMNSLEISVDKIIGSSWVAEKTFKANNRFKSHVITFNKVPFLISVEPIKDLALVAGQSRSWVYKQNTFFELWFTVIGESGREFSASPFIDQKFNHICSLGKGSPLFNVKPLFRFDTNKNELGCRLEPAIPSSEFDRFTPSLQIMIGRFSKIIAINVDFSHFHILTGPFQVPVPPVIHSVDEAVALRLVNLPSGTRLNDCFVQIIGDRNFIAVSPFNSTGHFQVTRTSARGPSKVHLTTFCDSQSLDIHVQFLDVSSRVVSSELASPTVYDNAVSVALESVYWIVKIFASIVAIAGVAFLFKKQIGNKVREHKSIIRASLGRLSITPQFSPHPHQDEDTFITEQPRRRTTVTRWSSFAT